MRFRAWALRLAMGFVEVEVLDDSSNLLLCPAAPFSQLKEQVPA